MNLVVRRPRLDWSDGFDPRWSPRHPELACVANAVSLQMPHVEPYVVRSMRAVQDRLIGELADDAAMYIRQESNHHAQHRRFNDLVIERYPSLRRVDRWATRYYERRERRGDEASNVAFAAAIEIIAFTIARWTDRRLATFFRHADPTAAGLFLWHLAEEVEHKTVAFDAATAVGVKRSTLVRAMVGATIALAFFVFAGALPPLIREGRWWRPITWWRLTTWAFGFAFELIPVLGASVLGGHHPSQLVDPPWCVPWLQGFDQETGALPDWLSDGTSDPSLTAPPVPAA